MAELAPHPASGHWTLQPTPTPYLCADVDQQGRITYPDPQCPNWDTHYKREKESLDAIAPGKLWSIPTADSQATYQIISENPLVMAHVPYGDTWHATIRSLTLEDVLEDTNRQAATNLLFDKRAK